MSLRNTATLFAISFLAAGCASTLRAPSPTPGEKIVSIAESFIGVPYRYGGESPKGFDCSGLVFYSFERAGFKVPRTAAEQRSAAERVKRGQLAPGDLIFFRTEKRRVDHVGIYAGDGRFIHAPSSGRVVTYAHLDDPYYRQRFVGAGRFN